MSAGNPDQKVYVYAVFSSLTYSARGGEEGDSAAFNRLRGPISRINVQ